MRWFWLCLRRASVVLALPFIMGASCDEKVYSEHPLVEKILRPRHGFRGLTNRICHKYDGEICQTEQIREYLLEDEEFRSNINKLEFICNIGGRRFKVCLDQPGFCRIQTKCKKFFGMKVNCKTKVTEYIPASNYDFLLSADTKCFNKRLYSWLEI